MPRTQWIKPDVDNMTLEEREEYERSLADSDWSAPVTSATPVTAPVAPRTPGKIQQPAAMDPKVREYMMKKYFADKESDTPAPNSSEEVKPVKPSNMFSKEDDSAPSKAGAKPTTEEERTQKARDKAFKLQLAGAATDLAGAFMPQPKRQVYLQGWGESHKPETTQVHDYSFNGDSFRDAAQRVKSDAREDTQIADRKVARSDQDSVRADRDRSRQAEMSKQDPASQESAAAREYLKQVAPNATTMAGFENLSAAQVEKIAPGLYAAANAAQERKERYADRAQDRAYRKEDSAIRREMIGAEKSHKQRELSATQAKQKGLYESGKLAEDQYEQSIADTREYDPTSSGQWIDNSEWAPNWMKNDKAIQAQAAQSAWIEAYLRDASGAAIPPNERAAYAKDFFPSPGDTSEVVANKAALRQQKMANAATAAGVDPGQARTASFPKQVRKDGKVATVSSQAELDEARKEGWQ